MGTHEACQMMVLTINLFLKKSIPEMRLFPDFPNMSAVSRGGLVGIYFENPFFLPSYLDF